VVTRRAVVRLAWLALAAWLPLPLVPLDVAHGQTRPLRLIATTTLESSGFLGAIVPLFETASGTAVDLVVVGTGQAHDLARRGEGDVVLSHDPDGEAALVAEGAVVARHPVMANRLVIAGPVDDPAGVQAAEQAKDAFVRIAAAEAGFISRGDDSGSHRAEKRLWQAAGLAPESLLRHWYRSVGQEAGATMRIAAQLRAYTLVDSATLAAHGDPNLVLLLEPDPEWLNPYAIMMVNPQHHPAVNQAAAKALIDWLTGPAGQSAINAFRINGEPAFTPVTSGG